MKRIKFVLLASIIFILFSGCGRNSEEKEMEALSMVETSVAQTITALPTQTPLPTATESPTNTPTSTGTPTVTSTVTSLPTASQTATLISGSTSGNQSNLCDSSRFISDINIPDGTRFAPGTKFIKTWRIQNNGTCTWTDGYSIFFLSGSKLDGVSPKKLSIQSLKPGESIDVSVELIAPTQSGSYISYWKLQNGSNTAFGEVFYVQIQVSSDVYTPSPSSTLTHTATSTVTPTVTTTVEPSATSDKP